jgi:hypothetical protein
MIARSTMSPEIAPDRLKPPSRDGVPRSGHQIGQQAENRRRGCRFAPDGSWPVRLFSADVAYAEWSSTANLTRAQPASKMPSRRSVRAILGGSRRKQCSRTTHGSSSPSVEKPRQPCSRQDTMSSDSGHANIPYTTFHWGPTRDTSELSR